MFWYFHVDFLVFLSKNYQRVDSVHAIQAAYVTLLDG
jgi:hypothetical protein